MLQNTGSSWDVRHIDRHHAKMWCLDDGVTMKIGIIVYRIVTYSLRCNIINTEDYYHATNVDKAVTRLK